MLPSCGEQVKLLGERQLRLQAYFACCLRIMWIISMPHMITRALSADLKPSIGRTRRLMAR